MKMYKPCSPTDTSVKFIMPSEMLTKINTFSGMKLSIRRLSSAMDKLGYGDPVSKRVNGEPRKVYSVIEKNDGDEEQFQQDIKKEFSGQAEAVPF